jgi:hypothetical protein
VRWLCLDDAHDLAQIVMAVRAENDAVADGDGASSALGGLGLTAMLVSHKAPPGSFTHDPAPAAYTLHRCRVRTPALHPSGLAAVELNRDLDGELHRLWGAKRALDPEAVTGLPDSLEMP